MTELHELRRPVGGGLDTDAVDLLLIQATSDGQTLDPEGLFNPGQAW